MSTELTVWTSKDAPLPVRYEAAQKALAELTRVDECKEWADRAAAIASYARQKKNYELEKMAKKVRTRAKRRLGELMPGVMVNSQCVSPVDQTIRKAIRFAAKSESPSAIAKRFSLSPWIVSKICRTPESHYEQTEKKLAAQQAILNDARLASITISELNIARRLAKIPSQKFHESVESGTTERVLLGYSKQRCYEGLASVLEWIESTDPQRSVAMNKNLLDLQRRLGNAELWFNRARSFLKGKR
jgi:hypothetical protein